MYPSGTACQLLVFVSPWLILCTHLVQVLWLSLQLHFGLNQANTHQAGSFSRNVFSLVKSCLLSTHELDRPRSIDFIVIITGVPLMKERFNHNILLPVTWCSRTHIIRKV